MKKVLIILSALIILSMPFQYNYLETNAAIFSKAAGLTAKKVAKEVIQDSAINQAIRIAADETKKLKSSESRLQKEGHMLFCMDYTYKPGGDCKKPANIKQNLTETDKANIKRQSGTELDKLTSPSGKGFTKWQKFLDWFVPIWLITFAVTAITYAIDPDVKSLFDEAAYNSLVALGIIAPVSTDEKIPLSERETPDASIEQELIDTPTPNILTDTYVTGKVDVKFSNLDISPFNTEVIMNYETITSQGDFNYHYLGINNQLIYYLRKDKITIYNSLIGNNAQVVYAKNGVVYHTEMTNGSSSTDDININIGTVQIESIRTRLPYKVGDFYYTDVLLMTLSGDEHHYQIRSDIYTMESINVNEYRPAMSATGTGSSYRVRATIYRNVEPNRQILVPSYDDSEMEPTNDSSYQDENGNMALLPPVAFTYEEEGTGEQVERKENPGGDGYTWQKPDGTEVPEENVIPREEEEPRVTPSPEGTPQYTPAPTPSNPNPEPEPLQPDPTAPPANPEPEEPPLSEFPEGSRCEAKLQFPIFSPLKETFSTSFPFSIPWDIERAINAAFSEIGNEKPSFELPLKFNGNEHVIQMTMPKFFDNWKPFTDSLLLIIFDIMIMFGVYRFVKGAGS